MTDGAFAFEYRPGLIRGGAGCVGELGGDVARAGAERALVVTGRTVGGTAGVIDPVRAGLGDRLAGVFARTTPEKRIATALAGADRVADAGADAVVAVGGGSSLDVARAVAVLAGRSRDADGDPVSPDRGRFVREFARRGTLDVADPLPVLAVPTTLAGADLSQAAGLDADGDTVRAARDGGGEGDGGQRRDGEGARGGDGDDVGTDSEAGAEGDAGAEDGAAGTGGDDDGDDAGTDADGPGADADGTGADADGTGADTDGTETDETDADGTETDDPDAVSGGLSDPSLMPAAVHYDPELFRTTPRDVLCGSAMNGFDKAVEAAYARATTPVTDATAARALDLLSVGLPKLGRGKRDDRTMRQVLHGVALAQYGASRPSGSTLSVVHAYGHALRDAGLQQGVGHAVVVPHVLRDLFGAVDGGRALLASGLGVETAGRTDAEVAEGVVAAVARVRDGLGLPVRLRDVDGPDRADLPAVARAVLDDGLLSNRPPGYDPTVEDVEGVLERAW